MYETYGLMVKITNPQVLQFLRKQEQRTNTEVVESALRLKLGLHKDSRRTRIANRGAVKKDCLNAIPVKLLDKRIIEHIISQKREQGVNYRHTVESAVINMIGGNNDSPKCD